MEYEHGLMIVAKLVLDLCLDQPHEFYSRKRQEVNQKSV